MTKELRRRKEEIGKSAVRQFVLLFFGLVLFYQIKAQTDWEIARNKDGVLVYTKNYKDKGLKQLKAETTVSGVSLHSFVAVFKDIDHTKEWTANLRYSKCLKTNGQDEYINYFLVDIPWPLRRREGIFKVNISQDKIDNTVIIESNAMPDFLPETDSVVRIYEAKSVWKFTPIGNNTIKVQSVFYADPRGFPPFLVNLFVTDSPLQTMTKLREVVKASKYKNARFDFINE